MGEAEIFDLGLQRNSFQFFADQLKLLHPSGATDRERIEAVFGTARFIYLERKEPTRGAEYDHDIIFGQRSLQRLIQVKVLDS